MAAPACTERSPSSDEDKEVAARIGLIQPVLADKVRGQPSSGTSRAKRNLAEHALLGQGAEVLEAACKKPQAAQRSGRALREYKGRLASHFEQKAGATDFEEVLAKLHEHIHSMDAKITHMTEGIGLLEVGQADLERTLAQHTVDKEPELSEYPSVGVQHDMKRSSFREAVLAVLRGSDVGAEGLQLCTVAQRLGVGIDKVKTIAEELMSTADLYTTIDDDHVAAV